MNIHKNIYYIIFHEKKEEKETGRIREFKTNGLRAFKCEFKPPLLTKQKKKKLKTLKR